MYSDGLTGGDAPPRAASRFAGAVFVFLVAALACTAPDRVQESGGWQSAVEQFGAEIAADVEHDGVGAITAALARDGEVLWSGAYGWADPEGEVPAARETIYRTGSISKSFTAVLMAILIDDGTVTLDTTPRRSRPRNPGPA